MKRAVKGVGESGGCVGATGSGEELGALWLLLAAPED